MKNQTAVDYLWDELIVKGNMDYWDLLTKAKQMEKEQIEVAYDNGWANALKYDLAVEWGDENINIITPEKYYNEQYGK